VRFALKTPCSVNMSRNLVLGERMKPTVGFIPIE
jgi:hypothetical protein